MCTLLSRLSKHKEAFTFAEQALKILNISFKENGKVLYSHENKKVNANFLSIAIIAYYNAGVEAEFLTNYSYSQTCYETALTLVNQDPNN